MQDERVVEILGGDKVFKSKIKSEVDFAIAIDKGLSIKVAKHLQTYLGLTEQRMAEIVHLSPKTYRSRKTTFGLDEGNHIYMTARVVALAERALGNKASAIAWLEKPQTALGGEIPLKLVSTSAGALAVEDLLGRIEYGVYS